MKRIAVLSAVLLFLLTGCSGGETVGANDRNAPAASAEDSVLMQASKVEAVPEAVPEAEPEAMSETETSGVTPELKEFLDSYEAFMDDYVAFMTEYQDAENPLLMLADYSRTLLDYADFCEKFDAYDTAGMSNADAAYYLEVSTRVAQKLIAALPEG